MSREESMTNPLDQTIETYRQHFDKYVERTPSEPTGEYKDWMDSFLTRLPVGGRILEIGSASGRDARYFASKGMKVLCTDIVPQALDRLSEQGFETAEFDFRDQPKSEWINAFDGFFANAVLLHATQEIFERMLMHIAAILKTGGTAAFSLKMGKGEEVSLEKMEAPRYYHYYSEQEVRDLLKNFPFKIVQSTFAEQGKWLMIVMERVDHV